MQLVPDVERFERRDQIASTIMLSSVGVFVAAMAGAAVVASRSCPQVPSGDPNRAADLAAVDACVHHHNLQGIAVGAVGTGIALGVLFLGGALKPDLFELVDKHNQLAPQVMEFAIGYDPGQRLATGGVALAF